MKAGIVALALVLASPAVAAESYGPVVTVKADETVDQAAARYRKAGKCAERWTTVGIFGGAALDIATTQHLQARGHGEMNPIYGKHASIGEQLVFNAATGAFRSWQMLRLQKRDPFAACKVAKIGAGIAFLPGLINLRLVF